MSKKQNKTMQMRQSDIKRMQKQIVDDATRYSYIVILNVMRDYFGFGPKRLKRVFDAITTLSEEICEGRISFKDLEQVLYDEAGILVNIGGKSGCINKGGVKNEH